MVAAGLVLAIKILTGLTTLLVVLSPCAALARVVKAKDVGSVSMFPLLVLLCSSHLWMMYGAIADLIFPVFSVFVVGVILAVIYLVVYWRYAGDQRGTVVRRTAIVVGILAVATLYAVLGVLGHTNQSRRHVALTVGLMADGALMILYGAPMEKMAVVLKTKSAACIQAHMVLAGVLNNVAWLSYGVVTHNWLIIGPNCLFLSINASQLALCIVFRAPRKQPQLTLPDEIEVVTVVSDETSSQEDEVVVEVQSPVASDTFHALSSPAARGTRV